MDLIPSAAIYRGLPNRETIRVIGLLTTQDSHGRLYYRRHVAEGWRHLRGRWAYDGLNDAIAAIDSYRKGMATT